MTQLHWRFGMWTQALGFVAMAMGLPVLADGTGACGVPRTALVIEADGPGEGGHYNWFMAGAVRTRGAAVGLIEPLFRRDPATGEQWGWLASAAEWTEPEREVRLHLRPGVRWSDGSRFSAADMAFTIQTILANPALDGLHAARVRQAVAAVAVEDRHHVRLTFAEGQGKDFVETVLTAGETDALAIMQEAAWKGFDPTATEGAPAPLGTGPYLHIAAEDGAPRWRRDDRWWAVRTGLQPLPAPEWLLWLPAERTIEARARALTRGCIDWTDALPPGIAAGVGDVLPLADLVLDADSPRVASRINWTGLDPSDETPFDRQSELANLLGLTLSPTNTLTRREGWPDT